MMLRSGLYDIVVVQGLSKASNMITKSYLTDFALDPVYNRPLKEHSDYIAGMEMNRYFYETGTTREQCGQVVVLLINYTQFPMAIRAGKHPCRPMPVSTH